MKAKIEAIEARNKRADERAKWMAVEKCETGQRKSDTES